MSDATKPRQGEALTAYLDGQESGFALGLEQGAVRAALKVSEHVCECDWKGCHHKGRTVPAHDHGDVRTSPELCMACLHVCCGEADDEMDSAVSR